MLKLENGLTEAGNLRPAYRDAIRDKFVEAFLGDYTVTPKGSFVMEVADVDGKAVYAKIDLSITDKADALFAEPKGKEAVANDTEIVIEGSL